jgi:hypothetical protein
MRQHCRWFGDELHPLWFLPIGSQFIALSHCLSPAAKWPQSGPSFFRFSLFQFFFLLRCCRLALHEETTKKRQNFTRKDRELRSVSNLASSIEIVAKVFLVPTAAADGEEKKKTSMKSQHKFCVLRKKREKLSLFD